MPGQQHTFLSLELTASSPRKLSTLRRNSIALASPWLLLVVFVLLPVWPATASAQGLELNGGYAYNSGNFGTNGFNVGAAWWFTNRVTMAANYDATWKSTSLTTFQFTQIGSIAVKSHPQNFLVGPRIFFSTKWTDKYKLNPFGEVQFGVSHLSQKLIQANQPTVSASDTAFSWLLGGGVDYLFASHWSGRANLDLLRTHFSNAGQSHFRLVLGITYTFGARETRPQPNRPPTASCSADPAEIFAGSGDSVSVRANATNPDNRTLNYTWTASGGLVEGSGPRVRWSSEGLAVGTYSVNARVDDGRGGITSCSAEVRVNSRPNRPPTISCFARPNPVHPGDRVHIAAVASDPDNDPLTYSWQSTGGTIAGTGADVDLDTTGVAPSRYSATGRVDDGRGGTAECQAEFVVEAAPPPAVEAKLALRSIYFPTGQPSAGNPDVGLIESQQETLTSLANDFKEYLASHPDAHLLLEGHSDSRGSAKLNQALSARRVDIAKQFLVGLGVPEASLGTKAHGEEKNLTSDEVRALVEQHPNLSQEQKEQILKNLQAVTLAQNRRVDITLSGTGQQSVRQFPFNAEDALTLLKTKPRATKSTKGTQ